MDKQFTEAEAIAAAASYETQIGAEIVKGVSCNALLYNPFVIPIALDADYIAADDAKKKAMFEIYKIAISSGTDFTTKYNELYNAL